MQIDCTHKAYSNFESIAFALDEGGQFNEKGMKLLQTKIQVSHREKLRKILL